MSAFQQRVASFNGGTTVTSVAGHPSVGTLANGTLLLAALFGNQAGTVTGVSDTKNTWLPLSAANVSTTSGKGAEVWACADFTSLGTGDLITVTFSATQDHDIVIICDEFAGTLIKTGTDSLAYTGSTGTTENFTHTGIAGDAVAYSIIGVNGTASSVNVSGTNWSNCGAANLPGSGICANTAHNDSPTTGSNAGTWTWTGNHTAPILTIGFSLSPFPQPPLLNRQQAVMVAATR